MTVMNDLPVVRVHDRTVYTDISGEGVTAKQLWVPQDFRLYILVASSPLLVLSESPIFSACHPIKVAVARIRRRAFTAMYPHDQHWMGAFTAENLDTIYRTLNDTACAFVNLRYFLLCLIAD
jgi:hypothetical protein